MLQSIKNFFVMFIWHWKNDPVKKCRMYIESGCPHVDGFLCDYPECSMLKEYLNQLEKEN